ncbi:MAG: flagellar basal body rod protein FlgF [Halioglobus sp.]
MDHMVYIAASGASESMLAQAINTHNLANASTPGFRADMVRAQSVYLNSETMNSRVHATQQGVGVDLDKGTINATGRELDVAINGDGWMAVLGEDGVESLSRRGDLRINAVGQLTDGRGLQVMGNSGPIALQPFSTVEFGTDGTISVVPLGEDATALAVVDRIRLVNPENSELYKGKNGLVQMVSGVMPEVDASVRVIPGALETSNVDSVGAMVHMIELARQFETQTKMMKVAEEIDQSSAELMKMG